MRFGFSRTQVVVSELEEVSVKAGPNSIWIPKGLQDDSVLKRLTDPDDLFSDPSCTVIKDQRKIKVGRVVLEIGGQARSIYLKRYNVFSWRYRLCSLFISSAAAHAWRSAQTLSRAGFQTGRPIAAVECRLWGMVSKSFYLSEEIPKGKTVDTYWREDLAALSGPEGYRRRRGFLRRLADLFRRLHGARLYHNDLKDANIIVSPAGTGGEENFYLLDLEGVRGGTLNRRRQIKNLVQLHRTMGRFLRRTDKLYWLKAYLEGQSFDRSEKRRWIGKILKESAKGDRRSRRKKSAP